MSRAATGTPIGIGELPIDMPVTLSENRIVATPALRAIIAERVAQLRKGYAPEADRDLAPTYLPKRARDYLGDAIDQLTPGAVCHDVKRGKRKLAQAAALLMAAYDAIADAIEGGAETTFDEEEPTND